MKAKDVFLFNKYLLIRPQDCVSFEIPNTSWSSFKLAELKQWAAVKTQLGSIRVPPQKCNPLESWIDTCQGCQTLSFTSNLNWWK